MAPRVAPAPEPGRGPPASSPRGAARARGGGWVLGQVAMMGLLLASARVGASWPEGLRLPASAAAAVLIAAGLGLLVAGALRLGSSLSPFPTPRAGGRLVSSGLYRHVRHPMYGGGILVALGWSVLFASAVGLLLTAALTVFLDLKARREEAWLLERYPEYDAYRSRTRRKLIPFVY